MILKKNWVLCFIFLPFFLTVSSKTFATSTYYSNRIYNASHDMLYLKLGTEVGAGYRWHQRMHGIDLSLNAATFFFLENWISAKALYLNYPFYSYNQFGYWGVGVGINHQISHSLIGGTSHHTYPAAEAIIGYEFYTRKNLKLFLQLEATVPLTQHATLPVIPAITLGLGF